MDSTDLRNVAIEWPREPHFRKNLPSKSKSELYKGGSVGQLEDATDSCHNRVGGVYRTIDDRLHVRIISRTWLLCKVTERIPRVLVATFKGDQQFRIQGTELDLVDNGGVVRARFIAASGE